jgi:HTH-type transcriptional regulator / antitoxin HigA
MPILNEREYRRAKARLERLQASLQAPSFLEAIRVGFSAEVIELQRSAVQKRISTLEDAISQYESLRNRNSFDGESTEIDDLGLLPVFGRIARGLSQRKLADALGMKEQQVQRYEAERYASIKLSTYQRVLSCLGISNRGSLQPNFEFAQTKAQQQRHIAISREALSEIAERGWFPAATTDDLHNEVEEYVHLQNALGPILLRLSVRGKKEVDWGALYAWKARVIDRANDVKSSQKYFDFTDLSWVRELAHLSVLPGGPLNAAEYLYKRGVVVIIEPHLPKTYLDGAAFLVREQPVIGMTIRFDRIDNFWFVLLHELGHIFLHHSSGLDDGFFDDMDADAETALEQQADDFAYDALIPKELWKTSPARFAKSVEPMRKFAQSIGVHEAIVVGRVRRERAYSAFSEFVGQGEVRRLFSAQANGA